MMSTEERVSKLEGAYEQVDERLGDLRVEMRGLRSDVNIRIDETNRSIEGLRSEVNSRIEATNRSVDDLRTEMNGRMGSMESRLNMIMVATLTSAGGIIVGLIAGIIALVTFILRT